MLFTYTIQIQHLLKLNSSVLSSLGLTSVIQIQHLLKLNNELQGQNRSNRRIQIQHLLKLNISKHIFYRLYH